MKFEGKIYDLVVMFFLHIGIKCFIDYRVKAIVRNNKDLKCQTHK